ncbi:TetR/AcrR family transcriptional regulator [Streptomyces chiangmaiensis]|uniref:TetR family transcriptional regulator n=1 Tax=Streptomyces chiangmaiensis TaxID=766497 RepID=A0ABU7FFI1_9ACTN|nr:TetR family transcriptional regulator [Streptomyces chiangmaiensis]MED7822891.1 TetR family transcriptional regulator [Streptomyces chiangmaiensis]
MPRPVNVEKRADLLKQVVHHLQHHGLAQTSLSSLADAVGTTKRMLLYYFGSRENLLSQALAANRADTQAMFDDVQDTDGVRKAAHALWEAVTVGEQSGAIRMLLQLLSLAATDPEQYGDLAAESVEVMTHPIAVAYVRLGHPPQHAWAEATLLVSGLRGLCEDRLVTHDVARTDAAAHRLIEVAVAAAD